MENLTQKESYRPTVTLQTVLSKDSIAMLEVLLHEYCAEATDDGFYRIITGVLSSYIKHYNAHEDAVSPDHLVKYHIRNLLTFREHFANIVYEEKPWTWVDTRDGWALPKHEETNNNQN